MMRWIHLMLLLLSPVFVYSGGGHQHEATPKQAETSRPLSIDHGRGLSLRLRDDGVLFAAWSQGEHVYLQRSNNAGSTFSSPIVVNIDPLPIRAGGESRVGLALGPDNQIFISFVRKLPKKWTSNLMFTRSLDGGFTFEPVRQINDDTEITSHSFPVMDVSPDGTLTLIWIDGRDRLAARKAGKEMQGLSLYGVRSKDNGKTFEPNQQLVTGTCQCCRLALTFNKQFQPVVLWRHIYGDQLRDHGLGIWREDGFHHQRFSHENWHFMGCPHQGPALAAKPAGGYHAAWYSVVNDTPSLFYADVMETGKHASKPRLLGTGMHPALLQREDQVYLIWLAPTETGLGLFGQSSSDQGQSWSEPAVLANSEGPGDHPQLLQHAGKVYWAWQANGQFTMKTFETFSNLNP
jgi:hypothetical protein